MDQVFAFMKKLYLVRMKICFINSQRQIPPILEKNKKFHGKIIEEWKHPYSYKPYQFIHYDELS